MCHSSQLDGCRAAHEPSRMQNCFFSRTTRMKFYHQHSMAISIKSNPVANSCPTHITVYRDMSPNSCKHTRSTMLVVVAHRENKMSFLILFVVDTKLKLYLKDWRVEEKKRRKKSHNGWQTRNTFNAFKSISSSEQFTEEASWCAILTYVSLLFSSLFFFFFFFNFLTIHNVGILERRGKWCAEKLKKKKN